MQSYQGTIPHHKNNQLHIRTINICQNFRKMELRSKHVLQNELGLGNNWERVSIGLGSYLNRKLEEQ